MELQPRAATGGPVSTFRIGGPRWDRGRWRHSLPTVPGSRQIAGLLGLAVNDATSGYRAWSADALRRIDTSTMTSDGYAFQVELTHRLVRLGGKVVEVPIRFEDRQAGTSKLSWHIVREELWLVTKWALADLRGLARWRRRKA